MNDLKELLIVIYVMWISMIIALIGISPILIALYFFGKLCTY